MQEATHQKGTGQPRQVRDDSYYLWSKSGIGYDFARHRSLAGAWKCRREFLLIFLICHLIRSGLFEELGESLATPLLLLLFAGHLSICFVVLSILGPLLSEFWWPIECPCSRHFAFWHRVSDSNGLSRTNRLARRGASTSTLPALTASCYSIARDSTPTGLVEVWAVPSSSSAYLRKKLFKKVVVMPREQKV